MLRSSLGGASWLTWPAWVVLNSLGVSLGYALALQLPGLVRVEVTDRMITIVMLPLIGLTLAVAQWLLVRLYLAHATLWIPVTFLGWTVPIVLLGAVFPPSLAGQQLQIAAALASVGLTMGAFQYLLLRPHRAHASWWIPASVLGWILLAIWLPIPIADETTILAVGGIPALITGVPFAVIVASRTPLPARTRAGTAT